MGKLDHIYREYSKCPPISWRQFNSNQKKYQKHVVQVGNNDFQHGTLRIKYPCAIFLVENIIFDPKGCHNHPNPYYSPELSKNASEYTHHGYVLGFFAALAIECKNVIIDLNCFEIRQSNRFFALQRFYSHIELADQPFLPKQGPADFGATIDSAEDALIMNGTLGLSSHHGIHGNNNKNIEFRDLKFKEFEVAAIALNGAQNILIHKTHIDGLLQVPLLGNFSAAVFIFKFARQLLSQLDSLSMAYQDLNTKTLALQEAIDNVASDIENNFTIDPNRESTKIFINESGQPDGTSYGILINGKGVAVNAFSSERPEHYDSRCITIKDVTIKNIVGNVHEIVALSSAQAGPPSSSSPGYIHGGVQTDQAGSVFQILRVLGPNEEYLPNVLANLQLALGRWSDSVFPNAELILVNLRSQGKFGTYSISPAIIAWGWPDLLTYNHYGSSINKNTKFSRLLEITGFKYIGNGDSMFHVDKGLFGIRLDKVKDVTIKKTKIYRVENTGLPGSNLPGPYLGPNDGGHFGQSSMLGFCGADSYGILTSACERVKICTSLIKRIISLNGTAIGLDINNDSLNYVVSRNCIKKIKSEAPWFPNLPNKIPVTIGIYIDKTSNKICLLDNKIHCIVNTNFPQLENKYVINNNTSHLEANLEANN